MTEFIPTSFYVTVGVIAVANIGTMGALMFAIFRGVWWTAKADSRINDAKDAAVRAHRRIDKIEDLVINYVKERQ
jgi:exo-beta-1,3-glucanase (GH17 family)